MEIKNRISAWLRAFKIWQKTGNGIWVNTRTEREQKRRGIFHGAFDSIPFLNDDAKRTFIHLMLRPGYMIRDYISGKHDIYMAPFAALIIFYSFFAMVSAVVNPDLMQSKEDSISVSVDTATNAAPNDTLQCDTSGVAKNKVTIDLEIGDSIDISQWVGRIKNTIQEGYLLLHLDKYPDHIDTRWKGRLAVFESTMRSQGVTMFIGDFLLLWAAVFVGLRRKHGIRLSAAASMAAYMLCQICFLKMFTMLFTFGRSLDASVLLTMIVLMIDYRQILNVSYKRSLWLTIKTGLLYGTILIFLALLLVAVVAIAVK